MKFGKELQVNAVPSWRDKYVSYKRLKRILKRIQHEQTRAKEAMKARKDLTIDQKTRLLADSPSLNDLEDPEAPITVLLASVQVKAEFFTVMEEDLSKIKHFYVQKESDLSYALEEYTQKMANANMSAIKNIKALRQELLNLYKAIADLQNYVSLNFNGLRKIAKKFDKVTNSHTTPEFIKRLERESWYLRGQILSDLSKRTETVFATLFPPENQQMAVDILSGSADLDKDTTKFVFKPMWLLIAVAVFILLVTIPMFPASEARAQKCCALVAFVTILWASEALPFFVTSLMIPLFAVLMRIEAKDPTSNIPLLPQDAASTLFAKLMNPTLMLVLGGFSISKALAKFQFAQTLSMKVLSKTGTRPRLFLLAVMFLGFFLSMWMSNVAAPVLIGSVLLPIYHDLPHNSRYLKSLLLGLAFSCNIGGMASPISSPQNVVAISVLDSFSSTTDTISFSEWISVSLPFCIPSIFILWGYLLYVYPTDVKSIPPLIIKKQARTTTHWVVLAVSLTTIALWCTLALTEGVFGNAGVVSLFPLIFFFGTGILTKDEFNEFSWNLIFLMGGGSVLGEVVSNSRLLALAGDGISNLLQGESLFIVSLAFCLFIGAVTTFVSHTVAAIVLLPICVAIGSKLGHPQLMVMIGALMCSGSMALPVSSFPNVNSALVEDDYGQTYLKASDYLKVGGPVSIIMTVLVASLGYVLCLAVGM